MKTNQCIKHYLRHLTAEWSGHNSVLIEEPVFRDNLESVALLGAKIAQLTEGLSANIDDLDYWQEFVYVTTEHFAKVIIDLIDCLLANESFRLHLVSYEQKSPTRVELTFRSNVFELRKRFLDSNEVTNTSYYDLAANRLREVGYKYEANGFTSHHGAKIELVRAVDGSVTLVTNTLQCVTIKDHMLLDVFRGHVRRNDTVVELKYLMDFLITIDRILEGSGIQYVAFFIPKAARGVIRYGPVRIQLDFITLKSYMELENLDIQVHNKNLTSEHYDIENLIVDLETLYASALEVDESQTDVAFVRTLIDDLKD